MNVLHLRQSRQIYGPEKTLVGLCEALNGLGHRAELALIYRTEAGDPPEHPLLAIARAHQIPVTQLDGRLSRLPALIRWLRERLPDIDLLHTHDYKADLVGMVAMRGAQGKTALVATPRHTETTPLLRALQWLDAQFLNRFDRLTAPSEAALGEFGERNDLLTLARVVEHGTGAGEFGRADPLPGHQSMPVISLIGRLHPVKGHDHFFAAAARVLKRYPSAQVWVAGDGPLRKDLEELARSLGIAGNVSFLGYRADIDNILAASAVTVIASSYESSCRVAMEALHLGCPLVATPVGVIPQMAVDGEGVLLVPYGDSMAMAQAVLLLIENRELAASLAARGKAKMMTSRSHREAAMEMAAVYEEAIGEVERRRG